VATVLYPTRGGDTTYRNQDWACDLALERGADLLLLYVSNVHFLDHASGPVQLDVLQKELDELGRFLLAMAEERAQKRGTEANRLVLHGEFRQALKEVVQENDITAVVLGRPSHDTAVTTIEYINSLARSITAEFGVESFVVNEGEVVEHYSPKPNENPYFQENNP
jgi:nucleotide-binding universal stress UspA family protein